MKRKQWVFVKIIITGNILFILWDILRHKTYWIGASNLHRTFWQTVLDISHNWWYGMPEMAQNSFVFTMTSILLFILSLIMED